MHTENGITRSNKLVTQSKHFKPSRLKVSLLSTAVLLALGSQGAWAACPPGAMPNQFICDINGGSLTDANFSSSPIITPNVVDDTASIFIATAGDLTLNYSGSITNQSTGAASSAYGIFVRYLNVGVNTNITFSGNIDAQGALNAGGMLIEAPGGLSGIVNVNNVLGSTIKTVGQTSHGISVDTGVVANITQNGSITATGQGSAGIKIVEAGSTVTIGSTGNVQGGWGTTATDVGAAVNSSVALVLNNEGTIGALSSLSANLAAGSVLNNQGTVDGIVTFAAGAGNIFNNQSGGVWNIHSFADTNGDGSRDTKQLAVSDFGGGVFNNNAGSTINLSPEIAGLTPTVAGYIPQVIDPSGAPIQQSLPMTNPNTVHGYLTNLSRFSNQGTISLSENGIAGDVFVITASTVATTPGGTGIFESNGGLLKLDAILNNTTDSISDVLVVDNAITTTPGSSTIIQVKNIGGLGAVTVGDGIKVVDVLGTSSADAFKLSGKTLGGLYDYTLHQGSITVPGNQSWYLRATDRQINPDVGSYLANQHAATDLFMHSLHDRVGEAQYYENYAHEKRSMPGVWLRGVAGHTNNEAADGILRQKSSRYLVHLGGEVADWTSNGDNRYHLGLMGAYGRYETKTISDTTGHKVDSHMDGYGVGAYFTWYSNEASLEGWYTDVWSMYNWFENKTDGSDNYDSESWLSSIEIGYASKVSSLTDYHWMVEPHAQISYAYYKFDELTDANGLTVTDSDADGISSRVGGRTYLRPSSTAYRAQPFVEVNWLYNSKRQSMVFNGRKISDDTPKHKLESKVGVQGEITNNLGVYSHIGLQWGKDGYEQAEGQVGVKYRF